MKGIVFNLLEQVVVEDHGEQAWESLLDATGMDGAFTAVGSYPDEDLTALVSAASEALGTEPDDLVRWFGRRSIPLLAARYPGFFTPHNSTREFLLTLNDVIHPEVRKLFPGAYAPSFEFDTSEKDHLGLSYHSHRNLCSFAEGLIQGAAEHYREHASIDHVLCTKQGDDRCLLRCSFDKAA
jgi:hypothetical protein